MSELPVVQQLLDFLCEHNLDEHIYLVAAAGEGDIELLWQPRLDREHWQVRPKLEDPGPWERVASDRVLSVLSARRVDMQAVERELRGLVATQIAFADAVLRRARSLLGQDAVREVLRAQEGFAAALEATVARLAGPQGARAHMHVVAGEGARTQARAGHLRLLT